MLPFQFLSAPFKGGSMNGTPSAEPRTRIGREAASAFLTGSLPPTTSSSFWLPRYERPIQAILRRVRQTVRRHSWLYQLCRTR